ncbi:Putative multidrug export ATP-binding/permease protein SAV1866 [Serratia liquefaciens]|jgi:ATP-binding cassette subfamily B protein|uniref:ABCB family ABC transporter ATP-binding protein/permease n=1 Tax=Serratia TaxID=613 RepID=UPI000358406E|nr:ABC transporter ATP-binding protein/permease [Serratia liquefaciens]AGQ32660.1 metal ABC transporter permease [Serratia liquefaciens ATCC 27592]CAI1025602.1 Putative multidrug export ATP-binding/permease protein SAV1866 [Serratia liquefaciens]CAI1174589.1 Putative multidrug export ATP-binding/permease protein SAV1866 [Serratia liquefaciens]CAI2096661.1 Putative multidrug export ATP-binding/permease protein SAV1866 [Serratia liquefaciens]CAI2498939.1 Putative multidrug export ATP-binding/per
MDRSRLLKFLLPYLWPKENPRLRYYLVTAFVFMVVSKVSITLVPLAYKAMVDALSGETAKMLAIPIGLILAYGVARVGGALFEELRNVMFVHVSQNATRLLGLRVFRQLHALSLRFHLERQTGGLSLSIERGTQAVATVLSRLLFSIFPILFEITLVSVIMWHLLNGWFALAIVVTVGCYILFTVMAVSWRTRFRRELNRANADTNSKSLDSLLNYETVKYFGNEDFEADRFNMSRRLYEYAAIKNQFSFTAINLGQTAIISIGLIVMMAMAAQGIVQGRMTVGDFVLVNAYLLQLYQPLNFFGFIYAEVRQALIDMENMFDLLQEEQEIVDRPDATALQLRAGEVRFDSVSFGYDERRPILKNVSFTIPAGNTVAIVGASGAGKSTLSRLLFRFYDVSGGAVSIDGQDIRSLKQASLRAAIGIVPQDTVLFNDTLGYNIGYGKTGSSQEEIERAARLAHIHEFIVSLPDGYETRVGERGLKLSGGEKQRVAIARTILKNPAILVFDEATSALDTQTEREIQAHLREVSRDHTTLVIAHRLSTVVDADEIIVLEAGEIVERGRHDALLAANGRYAAMWQNQYSEEQQP